MQARQCVVWSAAIAALVLNPFYACDDDHPVAFDFGATEMRAAVEGTWRVTFAPEHGPRQTFTISIAQGGAAAQEHADIGLISVAAACSERSFVKSAAACDDLSRMPLDIRWIAGDGPKPLAITGELIVIDTSFRYGTLELRVKGGHLQGPAELSAALSPAGLVLDTPTLMNGVGTPMGTATLVRIKGGGR